MPRTSQPACASADARRRPTKPVVPVTSARPAISCRRRPAPVPAATWDAWVGEATGTSARDGPDAAVWLDVQRGRLSCAAWAKRGDPRLDVCEDRVAGEGQRG